jgi:hypothetical protein
MNLYPVSFLRGLVMTLAVLLVAPCFAQQDEQPRQYEIELLVFQNLIENDGGEVWPADYSEWFEESGEDPQATESRQPANIAWLPETAHRLRAEWDALRRSAQYRPLAYLAWRQDVLDRQQAIPLDLPVNEAGTENAYVDGSVRVAVERYLHLYLDLQLHTPMMARDAGLADYEIPEFRLREQRRMRSKEVHYFDHPRFGVMALITPYEAIEAKETAVPPDEPVKPAGTPVQP